MKVTVIEQVEHSADITAEMFKAYLIKQGWAVQATESVRDTWLKRADSPAIAVPRNDGDWFVPPAEIIGNIAWYVKRKPHEVLADIAEGR